ncbi:MAG: P-loop NTPase fold protein [Patescibacteria group bacterium]|nr:P-loop NTPase fold protein [Patescibacteria group bacterium]MDD4304231.1 P-loop NTPase fold protein [Patescibacteria group bacterium]MDD4695285.1 P-loop NTPase fold protein [Patescibacteria group bacterium]
MQIKSREKFIKNVVDIIEKNYDNIQNESFIFGISGKWGEGKTTFLDSLSNELKIKGYESLFDSKIYNYLNIGNYKYWIIDNILNKAKI